MAERGKNKVILIGNLGQDVELRYTPSGAPVAAITVATSEKWKDQQGQPQERTEWHRVVLWQRKAEVAAEYLRKGSKIYIEGKLRTRKYQDPHGQDRYVTEIIADEMQMLETSGANGGQNGGNRQQRPQQANQQQRPPSSQRQPSGAQQPANYNEPPLDFDDDIPF